MHMSLEDTGGHCARRELCYDACGIACQLGMVDARESIGRPQWACTVPQDLEDILSEDEEPEKEEVASEYNASDDDDLEMSEDD